MFVYLHTDTHTCMQAHVYSLFCCLRYPLGRHVFSEHMEDRAGALQGLGAPVGSQWQAPLEKDQTVWCPASASPRCNSEGRQEVKAKPHTSGGADAAMVVRTQLCMSCRREPSEYSFLSADKDIPTVHVHLHQTGVMNILHPTQVRPTCPWRCLLWYSTCLWAAAEMSSSTCPQQHRWADGCLRGKQAAQLFLLPHYDFICGEKISYISSSFFLLLSTLRKGTLVYIA